MLLKKYTTTLAIVLSMSLGACWAEQQTVSSRNEPRLNEYFQIRKQTLKWTVPSEGQLQIRSLSSLVAPARGKITTILVDDGQFVRKGETIAWLDSPEEAQAMLRARGKTPEQSADWAPYFRKVPVLSDRDGFIESHAKNPEAAVEAGEKLFTLATDVYVEALIKKDQEALIKPGHAMELNFAAMPGAILESSIASVIDAPEGKLAAIPVNSLISALPEQRKVQINYFVKRKIDVLAVPQKTLTQKDGAWIVNLAYEKTSEGQWLTREQTVTIGENSQGLVEILSGLKEGDLILVPSSKPARPSPAWSAI